MGHNLIGRDVEFRLNGRLEIEGVPLRFFNFMMFDPAAQNWRKDPSWDWLPDLRRRPGDDRLCRNYAERPEPRGYAMTAQLAPLFDVLPNGQPFDAAMRGVYRDALLEAERTGCAEPPNPVTEGTAAFVSCLNEPVPGDETSGTTRLELATQAEAASSRSLAY